MGALDICKVCGYQQDDHALGIQQGVVVAGVYVTPNKFQICLKKKMAAARKKSDNKFWAAIVQRDAMIEYYKDLARQRLNRLLGKGEQ